MKRLLSVAAVLVSVLVVQAAEAGPVRWAKGKAFGGAKRVKSAAGSVICRGGRCG